MRRHSHKAESAQCRSAPVGTVTMEIDQRSAVRTNESLGNWHRAPETAAPPSIETDGRYHIKPVVINRLQEPFS